MPCEVVPDLYGHADAALAVQFFVNGLTNLGGIAKQVGG